MTWVLIAQGTIENCAFNRTKYVYWCGGNSFWVDWFDTTTSEKEGSYAFHARDWESALQEADVTTWEDDESYHVEGGVRKYYEYHL